MFISLAAIYLYVSLG